MYAFPRRSVGTRNGQRNVCIPTQERGNEKITLPLSLFPCSRVGTRNGQRNVCIPTQERGNEKITLPLSLFPCSRVGTRNGQRNVCIPTQERGTRTVSVCMHSHAGAWEREMVSVMYAFPRRSVGTRKSPSPSPCSHAPAWERETVSVCMHSHAGAWEREMVSVMYAFPRRSVGTRNGQRNVCIPTQERGNEKKPQAQTPAGRGVTPAGYSSTRSEIYFLFPCSRVGTRNGQRNVCIPTQERGNEKKPQAQTPAGRGVTPVGYSSTRSEIYFLFPCSRVGTRNGQRNVCIPTQERGNEKITLPLSLFPCSRVGTRNGQRNVCIPAQERGNEKITLPLSLFPCSRVGTRNGQRNVCIPTQERGSEKACQTCMQGSKLGYNTPDSMKRSLNAESG